MLQALFDRITNEATSELFFLLAGSVILFCIQQTYSAHEHMHVPHSDTQLINRLRRQQNIKPNDWDQVEELVDPAVRWHLDHMRMKGWEAPEIGYEAVDDSGAVIAEFEAAWPNRKYALVVNESDKVKFPPWKIEAIGEATRLA